MKNANQASSTPHLESGMSSRHHHLVCWKSTIGGVLVTTLIFMILTSLGMGIGGFTAENLIGKGEGGSTLASAGGIWLGLSCVMALFCGSYFTLRISRFMTTKVGAAHGFVVASIFFTLFIIGAGNLAGGLARGVGKLAQGATESAGDLSANPFVQDSVNKSLGSATFKSPPKEVAQGLAVRLLQGDVESAKSFYAYESGLPQSEVDAKMAQLRTDFDNAIKRAGEKTAHAVGDTGMSLFVVLVVGLIGAISGGWFGARSNVQRPIAQSESHDSIGFAGLASERGSVMPYVLGWFLGVPVSILFLIAMLRAIF